MLQGKHLPGTTEACLYLIEYQPGSMARAEFPCLTKVLILRDKHSLALHRFEDKGRDILFRQFACKRLPVVELDLVATWNQGIETIPLGFMRIQRERAVAQAMKGWVREEPPRPPGALGSEVAGRLDPLGT